VVRTSQSYEQEGTINLGELEDKWEVNKPGEQLILDLGFYREEATRAWSLRKNEKEKELLGSGGNCLCYSGEVNLCCERG